MGVDEQEEGIQETRKDSAWDSDSGTDYPVGGMGNNSPEDVSSRERQWLSNGRLDILVPSHGDTSLLLCQLP